MAELKELNDLYGINIPEDAKQVAEEAEKKSKHRAKPS